MGLFGRRSSLHFTFSAAALHSLVLADRSISHFMATIMSPPSHSSPSPPSDHPPPPLSQSLLSSPSPAAACPSSSASDEYDEEGWRIRASQLRLDRLPRAPHPPPHFLSRTCCIAAFSPVFHALGGRRRYELDKYYDEQSEILRELQDLDAFAESCSHEPSQADEEHRRRESLARREAFAIRASNFANMLLFVLKVFVSIRSRSLAIIASTLDSFLDLLSGFILWFTAHTMKRPNPYVYPIGKNRMQPVGILVFASVMATLGLQIIWESAQRLIAKDSTVDISGNNKVWIISIMVSVSVVKFFLMILCRLYKNDIVLAYAKDHMFDVVTNSVGLAAALLAAHFVWWIDPFGAIVLALYTIWNWSNTVLENVKSLVGETAPPEFLQKLTYLSWNHHPDVKQIDTVRAYTFGGYYFVEVDIVLEENMPLRKAHDIGESLQNKLERLPEVERAFVHLDFEVSHRPEHGSYV